mgnify:CR=1 FL=1
MPPDSCGTVAMKILDRYVLREFSLTLVYCVCAFAMIEVIADLFDKFSRLVEARLGPLPILLYFGGHLTRHLEFIMPAALLLTTLYTLWRFSRYGELTAMRASGISIYRVMLPLLLMGALTSLGTAGIKEWVAPRAGLWADTFRARRFREVRELTQHNVAYFNSTAKRQWLIGRFDLFDPTVLHDVKIAQERPDGTLQAKVEAERVEWLDGEWWLFDVRRQPYTEAGNPVGSMRAVPESQRGLPRPDYNERPADFANEVKPTEFMSAADTARYLQAHPHLSEESRAQRRVDMHLRLALPWACLVVTLFGIPAGARHARDSILTGILLTIVCFFAFYFLTQFGVFLGKRQVLSPWLAAWLSNIVFLVAGTGMLLRLR